MTRNSFDQFAWPFLLVLLAFWPTADAKVNIFITRKEMNRTLGEFFLNKIKN